MLYSFFLIFLYIYIIFAQKTEDIVKPKIQFLNNFKTGLRVSIPNVEGTTFFAFHGAINRFIQPYEFGQFYGVVTKSDNNNQWSYINKNIKMKPNDVLYYWYHIQKFNIKYNSGPEKITVSEITLSGLHSPGQNNRCKESITTVNQKHIKCADQLIFEDVFESFNKTKWKYEIRIPSEDLAFVSYQDRQENLYIDKDELNILPKVMYTRKQTQTLDEDFSLPNCQEINKIYNEDDNECHRATSYSRSRPPVTSAKIRSRDFHFTYGKVEIRAKLPVGDWIVPQITLEPSDYYYTTKLNSRESNTEYSSGQIRIACIRSNISLKDKNNASIIYDGRTLYGGAIVENRDLDRHFLRSTTKKDHFGEDYHIYTLIWTNESIQLAVDGEEYAKINGGFRDNKYLLENARDKRITFWKTGNSMAPFDREFDVSFGVSVGGMTDFPEDVINDSGDSKPWENYHPKAEITFFNNKEKWDKTWKDPALKVDSVRIYSV